MKKIICLLTIILLSLAPALSQNESEEELPTAIEIDNPRTRGLTSYEDIEKFIAEEFKYETIEGSGWMIPFMGEEIEEIDVYVILKGDWLLISTYIITMPKMAKREGLWQLMEMNYSIYQGKLGIDECGDLYMLYDIPLRLVDKEELIKAIDESASYVNDNYNAIKEAVGLK